MYHTLVRLHDEFNVIHEAEYAAAEFRMQVVVLLCNDTDSGELLQDRLQ